MRFIFFFLIISPVLMAQQVVSGRITDATDGMAVPGVSIYIANTTIGTSSDESGNYSITVPGNGSFEIVVSHVGYQSVFHKMNTPQSFHQYDVALEINEIQEIIIQAHKNYRQSDVDLFWRRILGEKPSKYRMEILNPEKVFYYLNSDNVLKVSCQEPIEIINHQTGYHILYTLQSFQHDYQNKETTFYGMPYFEELIPKNNREKNSWEKKRQDVYSVSITRFMRALYLEKIHEEGFLLLDIKSLKPVSLKDMIQADQDIVRVNIEDPLFLLCYSKPVTAKTIRNSHKDVIGGITLPVVVVLMPQQITIYPDGTYAGLLQIQEKLHSVTGLSSLLPNEYAAMISNIGQPTAFSETIVGTTSIPDSLAMLFHHQLTVFPQEKIYLHTDKPYYISGERIWFRAHVANAASHVPASYSQYVYVELINPLDTVVTRAKIRQEEGAYHGCLPIPEDVPEGDYTIRAYTTFMRSQDENYFCTKTIRIGDPQARAIHTETNFTFESGRKVNAMFRFSNITPAAPLIPQSVKISVNGGKPMNAKIDQDGIASINFNLSATSRKSMILLETVAFNYPYRQFIQVPVPDDDFDVTFYPEGGSFMLGTVCKTAFKAIKSNGQATHVTGIIYDQDVNEIAQFKSDFLGMGSFLLLAEKDKTYFAICQNEKEQTKRFDLPTALDHGYSLSVNRVKDKIYVSVLQPAENAQNDELYLIAHTRGVVYYSDFWNHENNMAVLQTDMFPSGVLHLVLFDAGLNPVSERLVFINHYDHAKLTHQTEHEKYSARSLVKNQVTMLDSDGQPLAGSFSVAVTSDREVKSDTTSNILTQFLLTSDLRGYIENPAYYFQNTNASAYALDLLMCTQGWRRYNMADVVHGRISQPLWPVEVGAEISGTVKSVLLGKPVEGVEVNVTSFKGNYFDKTTTDKDGRFSFLGGELPDSSRFAVSVVPKKGMTRMDLILDEETFPERTLSVIPPAEVDRLQFAKYADIAEQKYTIENGVRVIQLSDVTITAQRNPPKQSMFYFEPSHTITSEELNKRLVPDIYALLRQLPKIHVTGENEIYLSGAPVSFLSSRASPLLMLDDFPIDRDMLEMINVFDIAQIDILTPGPESAIFGSQGAGGAISIFTKSVEDYKKENHPKFHIKFLSPLGYQQPVEFYAPKYDTPEKQRAQTPDLRTTIHWQPVVQVDKFGMASFEFYTADEPTSYTVMIEGLTNDGKIIQQEGKVLSSFRP